MDRVHHGKIGVRVQREVTLSSSSSSSRSRVPALVNCERYKSEIIHIDESLSPSLKASSIPHHSGSTQAQVKAADRGFADLP